MISLSTAKKIILQTTNKLFGFQEQKELVDILTHRYGKDISNIYHEKIHKHGRHSVHKHIEKRISKKIIDILYMHPQKETIKNIILDNTPFALDKLQPGFSIKQWTEEEILDYIQLDVKGITANGNHDTLYDGVEDGRIEFLNDRRGEDYIDTSGMCFSIMKGSTIIGNQILRDYQDIKNCIKVLYIAIDHNYQNQGLSKHLIYESMTRAVDQGYTYFYIGQDIMPKGRGYVLHNYKKLAKLFPDIQIIQKRGSEINDIITGDKIQLSDII